MELNIKKLYEDAIIPTRGSEGAAGLDLYAYTDGKDKIDIYPFDTVKIKTGIAAAIPKGYFGAIFARSGIATKRGLRPANAVGVVDEDYRGEIIVALHNDTDVTQHVIANERIAQLVIIPCAMATPREVEDLDETARGDGGFGSTGTGAEENPDQLSLADMLRTFLENMAPGEVPDGEPPIFDNPPTA